MDHSKNFLSFVIFYKNAKDNFSQIFLNEQPTSERTSTQNSKTFPILYGNIDTDTTIKAKHGPQNRIKIALKYTRFHFCRPEDKMRTSNLVRMQTKSAIVDLYGSTEDRAVRPLYSL